MPEAAPTSQAPTAVTTPAKPDPTKMMLGKIKMGNNFDKLYLHTMEDARTHHFFCGATKSGKTHGMKVLAECLALKGVNVLAIDQMNDLTALAVPAGCPQDYERLGLAVPAHDQAEWEMAATVAAAWRKRIYARVLTPCSNIGERLALSPLTRRPAAYETIKLKYPDDLVLQADVQAADFLTRIGIKVNAKAGAPPNPTLSFATQILLNCWERDLPLHQADGMQMFANELMTSADPKLPEKVVENIEYAMQAFDYGAASLWKEGIPLNFDSLFSAPEGKTAVIIININHLKPEDRPWVVGQITQQLLNWCLAKGYPQGGGLRAGLIIDELAGDTNNMIMPPGNQRNHPSGAAIRRATRIGRHGGLTVTCGTQSINDIDYKAINNFKTKFIGKLSTRSDVDRAVYGLEQDTEKLKSYIVKAADYRLFAVSPAGDWELLKMRMLGTLDGHIQREVLERLYDLKILNKLHAPVNKHDLVKASIADLIAQYDGAISPQVLEHLQAAARSAVANLKNAG